MTKEQFLNGISFTVGAPSYKGAETFKYENDSLVRESRSSQDERVLFENHECNITKIGIKGFEGFTFILNKKVNVKYKFEELVVFKENVGV